MDNITDPQMCLTTFGRVARNQALIKASLLSPFYSVSLR